MKRAFLLILVLPFFIVSCREGTPINVLGYQSNPWNIQADITVNSIDCSGTITTSENGSFKIRLTSPHELSETEYTKNESGCFVSYGNVALPLSENACSGLFDIYRAFSLDEKDMISCKKQQNGNYLAVFESGEDTYELMLDGMSKLPLSINATVNSRQFSIEIHSMEYN